MGKKKMTWKRVLIMGGFLTLAVVLCWHSTVYALEDNEVIRILVDNESLFESNTIGGNILRYIGWGVTKGLAAVGNAAASLYDTCFGFVDFTTFPVVQDFIDKWKPVFISLVCLSLLLIGILMCVGWEKKPKIVINILLAVTVITSSTWVIGEMNSLISTGVREEILGDGGGASVVYNTAGTNIHDLLYLDQTIGLADLNEKNAGKVYEKFTKEQFENISINETLEPDEVSEEAEKIMANGIMSEFYDKSRVKYSLEELYDGVAWTDLLNEYYYRYTVDWGTMWLELLSLIIIYLFMSYKVIRCLYEIAVHQLLAYLYAANLNNNQKILKILDSLKDSYILLLMTTVMIRFYLLACRYITEWDVSGLSKGFILLFLAFAVIDGPNLVQKLTGADIGASDGMGKMMMLFYGSQMAGSTARTAAGIVKSGAGAVRDGMTKGKNLFKGAREHFNGSRHASSMDGMEEGMAGAGEGNTEGNRDRQADSGSPDNLNRSQGENTKNRMPGEDPGADPAAGTADGNQGEDTRTETGERDGDSLSGPDESSSTMPPDQGRNAEADHMEQIGQGMPDKQDALNGFRKGQDNGTPENSVDSMMDRMDQDVSSSLSGSMDPDPESGPSVRPLDTGGNMFKGNAGSFSPAESPAADRSMPVMEGKKDRNGGEK